MLPGAAQERAEPAIQPANSVAALQHQAESFCAKLQDDAEGGVEGPAGGGGFEVGGEGPGIEEGRGAVGAEGPFATCNEDPDEPVLLCLHRQQASI
ncbi:hypothetical protein MMC07_002597 [Pseudocyphellaria aurata]|nr:hypothetical protein [Pseudocyphellaria aurata]